MSVGNDLKDVTSLVDELFSGALLWVPAVVIGMSGILLSTAWSLVAQQRRGERERQRALIGELEQARRIQMNWLPKRGDAGGVEVHAVNHPASHVSGDFYNWFTLPDGRTAIIIGDVAGHGLAGAFLMSTTQTLVRSYMQKLADPAQTLCEVNRDLARQTYNGQFVTLLALVIDRAAGRLDIVSAGHPAPLVSDGKQVSWMNLKTDLVLGVEAGETYQLQSVPLQTPCSLLLFTDGVFECRTTNGSRYSIEQLTRDLDPSICCAPESFIAHALEAVDRFRAGVPLEDDLTAVAVRIA
ncbi:MAG: PP2C family protein-serine/threonine phosphatase [Tepidisphaeraceae bacterium]